MSAMGFGIPIILYIITYVLVVGALTTQDVKTMIWPTIALFQSFEIKGLFIERFESFCLPSGLSNFSPPMYRTDISRHRVLIKFSG